MNQIKLVYGSTILGRLFAAKDKNELRESTFRDFLGYTNFLVLGALVTKCFVNWKDKSLINYEATGDKKGIKSLFNWLQNSTVKTHQEVINSVLKQNVLNDKGGIKPLKELYDKGWIKPSGEIAKKLGVLNKAKAIGILYSCVALGIIVPLINKYMTESKKKKHNNIPHKDISNINIRRDEKPVDKTKQIISEFLKDKKVQA